VATISNQLPGFAEDPGAFIEVAPDEERIATDRYSVTFSPGEHFWSTSVARVRFGGDVAAGLAEIRALMAARGRTAAAWALGPSATPPRLVERLLELGLESESDEGSVILVLTEPPSVPATPFRVERVVTFEDHLAAIEVGNEAFDFTVADADDERRRAHATFDAEQAGGHTARLVAYDGARPVATGRAWRSPFGLYLGGGATIRSDRRRGAMSVLVAAAWEEAVASGTPALVTHGGRMAAQTLERLGFRAIGIVRHLIDRVDRS
jgi:hypothetical protein